MKKAKEIFTHECGRGFYCLRILSLLFVFFSVTAYAQQGIPIKGLVVDINQEPIIGVSVVVEGTTIGTLTDLDGKYEIAAPDASSVVVFSMVGFKTMRVTVGSQTTINQTLQEDVQNLEEVVVVGYGVQKKETVTGSVSTVKGDDLIQSPVANLSNAIAGRMSGVMTFQRSGEPGYDDSTIRIRGSNTLGNNDPLIVIDGVAAREGGLSRLDANEIESMSVLKDASAAIYGARAANGVILITTKKGSAGKKATLTYTFNQGWARPTQLPRMSDAAEYAELRNELIINDAMVNPNTGKVPAATVPWRTQDEIQKYRDGSDPWRYPNTDWFKETFKDWSPQQMHNATLEGGSEKLQYYAVFGHKYTDGLYHNSANNYKQFNLRVNLDAKVNDWVSVGIGMLGRQEDRNYPSQGAGDILWFTARGRPTDHAYWPNGLPGPAQEYGRNPVVAVTDATGYTHDRRYYIQTNAKVDITQPWIDGLKFTATVSYDKRIIQSKTWFQPWYLYNWDGTSLEADGVTPKLEKALSYPSHSDPSLTNQSNDRTNMTLGAILSYDKKIGVHGITALVGTEKETSDGAYFDAYRRYYLSTALQLLSAGGDKEKTNSSGGADNNYDRGRLNYFGRFAYNYQEKYLAEFVWRYDGSYMFPKDKRFGFFPGVLLGYRISEENFWKNNISFIDYFKIRGSWGQMGNDQVWLDGSLREFQFLSTYYYEWGYIVDNEDVKGLRISRFPNSNITWERANNFNLGIEGRTLNSRLYIEADYFNNQRSSILWQRNASIPKTTGLTLPAENIGKVNNTGFDFKIQWDDQIGRDIRYSLSATGGYAKNKIKFWDESPGAPEWQKSTGHPMNSTLYYEFDGVFKDWDEINDVANRPNYDGITSDAGLQPGDMKFKDIDGDGKITPDDRKRYDRTNEPTWTFGLNAFFQYKDFDISILFQGAADSWQKVYFDSGEIGNYSKEVYKNHWSVDNPTSEHPRVHARAKYYWDSGTGANNTYWMVNTKYIRLKNLEIGYTLPKSLLQKTKFFTHMRVYMNGNNLLTFSPSKDIDPESSSSNGTNYPQAKIINFGFSLTF